MPKSVVNISLNRRIAWRNVKSGFLHHVFLQLFSHDSFVCCSCFTPWTFKCAKTYPLSLRILYCSIFLPYIHYCSEIWENTYHSKINIIIIIQKRAIRLLFDAGRLDHTAPLFQRANVLTFTDIVKLKTAVFMYKAYHYMLPENIQRNVVKKDVKHRTRTKQQLVR